MRIEINRNMVPMVVTFDDDYVEFLCEALEDGKK